MPALSMFYGIIVRMQSEKGGKHNKPHIHAIRPTAVKVIPKDDYILDVEFDNGERKEFDVKPYIRGEWYGKLHDLNYFKAVETDGYTVVWPEGQDICPDELYELSKVPALV